MLPAIYRSSNQPAINQAVNPAITQSRKHTINEWMIEWMNQSIKQASERASNQAIEQWPWTLNFLCLAICRVRPPTTARGCNRQASLRTCNQSRAPNWQAKPRGKQAYSKQAYVQSVVGLFDCLLVCLYFEFVFVWIVCWFLCL